jgi:hypothetical protein
MLPTDRIGYSAIYVGACPASSCRTLTANPTITALKTTRRPEIGDVWVKHALRRSCRHCLWNLNLIERVVLRPKPAPTAFIRDLRISHDGRRDN